MAIGSKRPFGPNSASSRRGAGTLLAFALALGIGVSFGWTPSVPNTILLPDSLGPLRPGYHLAFGNSTNNIYVASESSDIIVVDGETFQRIKRINTGTPVGGALLVNQHNKLYCSYPQQGRIGVIDCASNNVVGSIQVGSRPTSLCYSTGSDKLYCGDTIDGTISVIACASNTVLRVIPVGDSLAAMAYDPTTSKVYAATRDAVRVISCSADSIVASIDAIMSSRGLCVNKRRQKLYVVGRRGTAPDTVYVISTESDSVASRIPTFGQLAPVLASNEVTDRVYGATEYGGVHVLEFDCIQDTFVRGRYAGDWEKAVGLVCDSVRNRLYGLIMLEDDGGLIGFDCATWDFLFMTSANQSDVLALDPARYRMICAGGSLDDGSMITFDYKGDSAYARGAVPLCGWTQVMCHNPATGRLYCRWGGGVGGASVVDEQVNCVVAQAFLSTASGGRGMTYSRTSNKFYFEDDNGLSVMDGSSDSLLRVVEMEHRYGRLSPCWCPKGNKVYCFASRDERMYVAAVDCSTDSVVREMDVYDLVQRLEYLGENRLLCLQYEHLTLIDSGSDSVIVDSAGARGSSYEVVHTGDGKKVYIVRNGRLRVRSSSTLSLLATINWAHSGENGGGFLAYSDTTRKLYWFAEADSVLAIDATGDTVVARMATSVLHDLACLDHTGRYLFCASPYDSALRVYDMQSDSLVAAYPLPFPPLCIAPNPDQGCIYIGCQDVVLVYPDTPSGVCDERATSTSTKLPPTVVRGVLSLEESPSTSCLMDATGRRVLDLRPGPNDIRHLAPGVYFVREEPQPSRHEPQTARKMVIAE